MTTGAVVGREQRQEVKSRCDCREKKRMMKKKKKEKFHHPEFKRFRAGSGQSVGCLGTLQFVPGGEVVDLVILGESGSSCGVNYSHTKV